MAIIRTAAIKHARNLVDIAAFDGGAGAAHFKCYSEGGSATGTLLADITLNDPSFVDVDGVMTGQGFGTPKEFVGLATELASVWEISDSNGVVHWSNMTAGTEAGPNIVVVMDTLDVREDKLGRVTGVVITHG